MQHFRTILYLLLYLGAIIPANLLIARFGPALTIPTAFCFIGLDLTSRDHLHEAWRHRRLFLKMAALLSAGSLLSWLLNRSAGPIALASLIAFAAAGAVDSLTYHLLRDHSRLVKVNGSNLLSAAVDSVIFPTLAFGQLLPAVVLGQFGAKVLGGWVWMYVLEWRRRSIVRSN